MKVDFEILQQAMKGSASSSGTQERFVLNISDCAGQPIFLKALHPLFFTPDTIYLAVFNMALLHGDATRQESLAALEKWLSMIWVNAPASPVILVGTHKDQVPADRRTHEVLCQHTHARAASRVTHAHQ
jgi:hypothetical protein